jgi:hypothetical protein
VATTVYLFYDATVAVRALAIRETGYNCPLALGTNELKSTGRDTADTRSEHPV